MTNWPTQAAVLSNKSIYGDPRGRDVSRMSSRWEAENLVYIQPPFIMRFAGKKVARIRVNKHCSASLAKVLDSLLRAAKLETPKAAQKTLDYWGVSVFGGVVQYRLMRGGNSLSIHSYGAAIDLDPAQNNMYDKTPRFAQFPKVLAAFKAEGWKWGGDWDGDGSSSDERQCDGMHWQATK